MSKTNGLSPSQEAEIQTRLETLYFVLEVLNETEAVYTAEAVAKEALYYVSSIIESACIDENALLSGAFENLEEKYKTRTDWTQYREPNKSVADTEKIGE